MHAHATAFQQRTQLPGGIAVAVFGAQVQFAQGERLPVPGAAQLETAGAKQQRGGDTGDDETRAQEHARVDHGAGVVAFSRLALHEPVDRPDVIVIAGNELAGDESVHLVGFELAALLENFSAK